MELNDLMTTNPVVVPVTANAHEAAVIMRDHAIGDVLVEHDGRICGIVTDRDLVVRVMAEGGDPTTVLLGDVYTGDVAMLAPDCSVEEAVETMTSGGFRRVPVVRHGIAVGIVSLGDLAMEMDRRSALAEISSAPPNT